MVDGMTRVDSDSRCVMRNAVVSAGSTVFKQLRPVSLGVSFKSPSWRVQQPGKAIHAASQ
jgi:hypothetical protein